MIIYLVYGISLMGKISDFSSDKQIKILIMKNLKKLSKKELRTISGGIACRSDDYGCPGNSVCCMSGSFAGLCRTPSQMATMCPNG